MTFAGIVRSVAQPRFVSEQQSGRSPSLSLSVPSSATIVVDTEGRASSSLLFGGGLTTANHNHSPSLRKGFGSPATGHYRLHSQQAGTPNGNYAHSGRANPSPHSQLNNGQNYYNSSSSSSSNTEQQQQPPASAGSAISNNSPLSSSSNQHPPSNNGHHYHSRDRDSSSLPPSASSANNNSNSSSHHVPSRNGPGLRWSQHPAGAQLGGPGLNQISNQSSFITNGLNSNASIGSTSSNSSNLSNINNNNNVFIGNSNTNSSSSLSNSGASQGGAGGFGPGSNPRSGSNRSSPTGGLIGGLANGSGSGGIGGRPGFGAGPGGSGGPGTPRYKPGLSSLAGQDQDANLVFRKVRGILNKLTPENFDKLSRDLLNVGLDSTHVSMPPILFYNTSTSLVVCLLSYC